MDLLVALVHVAVGAPVPVAVGLWIASVRWAKHRRVPLYGLGALALALNVHRNRRELRGVVTWASGALLALIWVGLLVGSPRFRFAVGFAAPVGIAVAAWAWLVSNHGQLTFVPAVRIAWAEWRDRGVLSEAVEASAEGARVVKVTPLPGGDVEAEIIGPAGVSHVDLVAALRGTLAESVLAQSGRVMRTVEVVGNGAKGAVKVRCLTSDPYAKTMTLDEVRRR